MNEVVGLRVKGLGFRVSSLIDPMRKGVRRIVTQLMKPARVRSLVSFIVTIYSIKIINNHPNG